MEYIDLRSDTVTEPTQEMIEAMSNAEVGDDVYGDDPAVNLLQKIAAKKMGKDDSLFVPSGTFANQLAIMTHAQKGDEVIIAESNHIVQHEAGAPTFLSCVQLRTLRDDNGLVDLDDVRNLIRGEDIHFPRTGLICTENAHSNGTVISLEEMDGLYKIGKENNIPVHLDGARIFNAAIALGAKTSEIAAKCDSVMFCLSKGLCCPIGSLLCGSNEFIKKARKFRKIMGGGMRQVGYMAAPGVTAIEKMSKRLGEDHRLARYLAEMLSNFDFIDVFSERLDVNMVFFRIITKGFDQKDFINYLGENKIKINPAFDGIFRLVTHYWIKKKDIDFLVDKIKEYKGWK